MVRSTTIALFVCLVVAASGISAAWGNSPPVVSNVSASQRPDTSQLVDITYDLADADGDLCTVWIAVSDDGGTTWNVPVQNFSGDSGAGVLPGTGKVAVWDAGSDMPGRVGSNFRVRVYADDGTGTPAKVVVPAGWFPYQNTASPSAWVYVKTFLIDKYDVTNAFYCQFLNNADPTGAHYRTGMEISRTGNPGSYYYIVTSGRENYPIRAVQKTDADAFAQWRSQLEGVTYRLPSGVEWEKAAAWDAIQKHYYLYGCHRDANIDPSWCNFGGSYDGPTPVGYFDGTGGRNDAKSFYGCYDMSGNVYQLTSDVMGGDLQVRGGYYFGSLPMCLCTGWNYFSTYAAVTGFRLIVASN